MNKRAVGMFFVLSLFLAAQARAAILDDDKYVVISSGSSALDNAELAPCLRVGSTALCSTNERVEVRLLTTGFGLTPAGWEVYLDEEGSGEFEKVYETEEVDDPANIVEWTPVTGLNPAFIIYKSESESFHVSGNGSFEGDGNGNGQYDAYDKHVASLLTSDDDRYMTVENESEHFILNAAAMTAEELVEEPDLYHLPYDLMSVTVTEEESLATDLYSVYVETDEEITGFVLYNTSTEEFDSNFTTEVEHGEHKTRIRFQVKNDCVYDCGSNSSIPLGARGAAAYQAAAVGDEYFLTFIGGPIYNTFAVSAVPTAPFPLLLLFALSLTALGVILYKKRKA